MAISILPAMGDGSGSRILVTAPEGAAVILEGPDGRVRTGSRKNGVYAFGGCGVGLWTVTASLGEMTASRTLEIKEEDQRTAYHILVTDTFQAMLLDFSALNFYVVGGVNRPADPPENTIWVQTAHPISSWYFSDDFPREAAPDGTVWIGTSHYSQAGFNALRENEIYLKLNGIAQQYHRTGTGLEGGQWSFQLPVEIFQNGQWVSAAEARFLYDCGDLCSEETGGWKAYYYRWTNLATLSEMYAYAPQAAFNDQSCTLTHPLGTQTGYRCGGLFGENLVERLGKNSLHIRINALSKSDTSRVILGVGTKKADNFSAVAYTEIQAAGEWKLDIAKAPESVYVFVGIMTDNLGTALTSVTFDQIWMT